MSFHPQTFAREWAAAWNARDLDAVLTHVSETVSFTTPKALEVVGHPTVNGMVALRTYWERALSRITSLHFVVVGVTWDPERREVGILYDREVNGVRDRALELLRLGAGGKVTSGEVLYGVIPAAAPADSGR